MFSIGSIVCSLTSLSFNIFINNVKLSTPLFYAVDLIKHLSCIDDLKPIFGLKHFFFSLHFTNIIEYSISKWYCIFAKWIKSILISHHTQLTYILLLISFVLPSPPAQSAISIGFNRNDFTTCFNSPVCMNVSLSKIISLQMKS